MRLFCFGLIICGLAISPALAGKKPFVQHSLDQAFHHRQTDLILPREIAGFRITEIARYGDSDFDGDNISVRYVDDNAKIDVYFYNHGNLHLEDDKKHQPIIGQIEETISVIKQLAEKQKAYRKIETSDQAQIYSFGDGLTMIQSVMRYQQQNQETDEFDQDTLESSTAVTIYANYFVKIRHSFSIPKNENTLKKRQAERQNFRSTICKLITDTEFRPAIKKALKKFKNSPQDTEAAGVIIAYAEASPLVPITINIDFHPYLNKDNFKGSEILLTAYMAGNIEAQFASMAFKSHDMEGVEQMLKTYRTLKKSSAVDIDSNLDRWLKLNPKELKNTIKKLAQEK